MVLAFGIVASLMLVTTGCSTTLTNMTPAKALEPLDGQVNVGVQGDAHSNLIGKTIDAGKAAEDQIREADPDEDVPEEIIRNYIDGGIAAGLFRPGVATEFMVRLGLTDSILEGLDAGIRYNVNVVKVDGKLQLFESEDENFAVAFQAGYGYHLSVVNSVVSYLTLTDWSRHDFDLMLSFGYEYDEIFKLWVAPRVITSLVSVSHKLPQFVRDHLPESLEQFDPNQLFEDEAMLYTGLTVGAMVGYKYAFLNLEVNAFRLDFDPTVLEEERDFDSYVFAPAGGFTVMWY